MERNEQSLSTREFASPDRPGAQETTIPGREAENGTTSEQARAESPDRPARSDVAESDLAPSATQDDPATGQAVSTTSPVEAGFDDDVPSTAPAGADSSNEPPLLTADAGASFQRRWEEVQTRFVDEPRGAVQDADALVANLMQQLAQGFAQEGERLEAHWDRGEDISTEDLRVTLQRYRSFFQRLLAT